MRGHTWISIKEGWGLRLQSERQRIGLTQAELAKICGVSIWRQRRFEQGLARKISVEYLVDFDRAGGDDSYVTVGRRDHTQLKTRRSRSRGFSVELGLSIKIREQEVTTYSELHALVNEIHKLNLVDLATFLIWKNLSTGTQTADNNMDKSCD